MDQRRLQSHGNDPRICGANYLLRRSDEWNIFAPGVTHGLESLMEREHARESSNQHEFRLQRDAKAATIERSSPFKQLPIEELP